MSHLAFLFGTSFLVAFSGAMMPGPMLTATISEALKRGFKAGPLIVLGHGILEAALLAGLVAGLGAWLTKDSVLGVVGIAGGLILFAMGLHMALTAGKATAEALATRADKRLAVHGPVLAGILTSLANPYWTLWWATIGLGYAAFSLESGLTGLTAFYSGHILADLVWYAFVAGAVASGRRLFSAKVYRRILIGCGVALVALGVWFFVGGIGRL